MRRFKRKTGRRFNKSGKPSTSRMSNVMKDRTFCKFKYVTLTDANAASSVGGGYSAATGSTLMPYSTAGAPSTSTDMYVFYPQVNVNTAGNANTFLGAHLLPGNSINLRAQQSLGAGTLYYSDKFAQEIPTGVDKWASFYDKYICHGSAIDVTFVSGAIPGQLVVLPVVTGLNYNSDAWSGYDFVSATYPPNWTNLINFSSLPDDQPYARIKFVSGSGGMDRVHIKHKMLTKKLCDVKDLRDDPESYARLPVAVTGSNVNCEPLSNQWCWFVAFIPASPALSGSANPPPVYGTIQVKMTYFLEMTERKNIQYVGAF